VRRRRFRQIASQPHGQFAFDAHVDVIGLPAGSSTSAGLTPGTWCSATRRGPRPTWRRCAAGA
jgi:hypothetical protein